MTPDDRRAAIVAATRPLVLRHGAAVTTRQIAEAADIAEGTIFRVFPDKESVIDAVVAETLDQTPTLRELAAVDRTLPFRERLTEAVGVLQRRVGAVFGLMGALGWQGRPPGRSPRAPRQPVDPEQIERDFRAAVADLIGPDARRLRVPAAEFAHVMRLLVFSATHPLISSGRPLDAEQIVGVLLDGLSDPSAGEAGDRAADIISTEDRPC
jgi:AcrR family transcriptional regulator